MVQYPTEIPISEIQTVISIIRSKEISAKKSEFAHALWVVQGFAQSKLISQGSNFDLVSQAATSTCCGGGCNAQAATDVESEMLVELQKAVDVANGAASSQAIIDWRVVLKFVAEKLVEYLLSQAL